MQFRWQELDGKSGVYLIGFAQYVKIGWSARIGRRLREIEEGLPEALTLYRIIENATMQDEHALHRQFDNLRTGHNREWFRNEDPITGFLGFDPIRVEKRYRGERHKAPGVRIQRPRLYVISHENVS